VIPAYNHGRYLGQAIESVFAQTFRDLDVTVVDDGSTDDTEAVVAKFGSAVRYVRQENLGLGAARNTGVALTKGPWLAFLDADDWWKPRKLERQVMAVEQTPHIGVAYTGAELVDAQGKSLGPFPRSGPHGRVLARLWENNFICSGSNALVRRASLGRVGGFDEARAMMGVADWDLWIRMAAYDEFAYVDEPLVCYRVRPDAMHQDWTAMMRGEYQLLRKYLDESGRHISLPGVSDVKLSLPGWSVSLARRAGKPREARRFFWAVLRQSPWFVARHLTLVREYLASFRDEFRRNAHAHRY
jgi:glycosyltransferase involved in cell wall biosynthesis